jgi:ATPase subunit of ABC transporter with duplicated ATPase domains
LIGVAGATGAGKTSLLNTLLEYPEMLPSSSTEAATATVCRIAYNHDDTPGNEFRADIKFRALEAVKAELSEVLAAVRDRKNLRVQEFEDENERIEAIEVVTDIISRGINKIFVVWGLRESEIEEMDHTVESVMGANTHILDLLGRNVTIVSSDPDEFSNEVKPYLDSTPTPEGVIAWPLIEEVRI